MKLYGISPEREIHVNQMQISKEMFLVVIQLRLPMKTAMKKRVTGIFNIGEVMFKNQLGLIGKNLRNSRKKKRLLLFSSTWKKVKMSKVGS